jgi:hypothetical protein
VLPIDHATGGVGLHGDDHGYTDDNSAGLSFVLVILQLYCLARTVLLVLDMLGVVGVNYIFLNTDVRAPNAFTRIHTHTQSPSHRKHTHRQTGSVLRLA